MFIQVAILNTIEIQNVTRGFVSPVAGFHTWRPEDLPCQSCEQPERTHVQDPERQAQARQREDELEDCQASDDWGGVRASAWQDPHAVRPQDKCQSGEGGRAYRKGRSKGVTCKSSKFCAGPAQHTGHGLSCWWCSTGLEKTCDASTIQYSSIILDCVFVTSNIGGWWIYIDVLT